MALRFGVEDKVEGIEYRWSRGFELKNELRV